MPQVSGFSRPGFRHEAQLPREKKLRTENRQLTTAFLKLPSHPVGRPSLSRSSRRLGLLEVRENQNFADAAEQKIADFSRKAAYERSPRRKPLRKNYDSSRPWEGPDFSRAAKSLKMSWRFSA